jgi:L-threonylcarbamoyladenylate synthase
LHPEAPGQLPTHYAPRTPLILVDDASVFVCPAGKRCGLLAWKAQASDRIPETRALTEHQDMAEAARNLFRQLRELDASNLDLIIAEKVPENGLGAAINDRLSRAATRPGGMA